MKKLMMVCFLSVALLPACSPTDAGCGNDLQCREGRVCDDARCQWVGEPPTDRPTPVDDPGDECESDEDCDVNSLCINGACDAFRCANEDGTDTSPDCDCNNFVYSENDVSCRHEMECFSGNLRIQCARAEEDSTTSFCTCFERLEPVAEFALDENEVCFDGADRDELSANCGWSWP